MPGLFGNQRGSCSWSSLSTGHRVGEAPFPLLTAWSPPPSFLARSLAVISKSLSPWSPLAPVTESLHSSQGDLSRNTDRLCPDVPVSWDKALLMESAGRMEEAAV